MGRRILRKTKIVATIGPASDSVETIKAMIRAGMNVARLNFSHGTHAEHRKRIETIREASRELGANLAILLDTRGVEIRTGRVAGGSKTLTTGETFNLYTDDRAADADGVAISYQTLANEVDPGARILLDDGVIELRVKEIRPNCVHCEITRGGRLGDRKGVNIPDISMPYTDISSQDREDILFAIEHDITYIAASFVRGARDVIAIRRILEEHGTYIPIIAKIESKDGVDHLDEIIAVADGTMVARGDLGVEIELQDVPIIQKRIIHSTVGAGKPVITATQMLDSMERNPVPTRAEVSDVANAIFDGTSAVMLSGETASGAYPVEAVRTMAALALRAEDSLPEYGHLQHTESKLADKVTDAVSQAAITMAHHLGAAAIVTLTETGFTSRSISKFRPRCPILAITVSADVVSKLSMNWGVTGIHFEADGSDDEMLSFAARRGTELGYVEPGDIIVVTHGVDRESGSTSMIRVLNVPD
ncbi:MAG: pyruvate kinase [Deltaproteobacteria bacterium]|nr:pyruvate kinase [Deltaproteobacteria bacterium]MBW2388989.1 pyruvate kinase [Deltaproteobacteria bacterium]MBW2724516.1 pyruvate kinase [Deltaproteobacteria bacterium]